MSPGATCPRGERSRLSPDGRRSFPLAIATSLLLSPRWPIRVIPDSQPAGLHLRSGPSTVIGYASNPRCQPETERCFAEPGHAVKGQSANGNWDIFLYGLMITGLALWLIAAEPLRSRRWTLHISHRGNRVGIEAAPPTNSVGTKRRLKNLSTQLSVSLKRVSDGRRREPGEYA